MKNENWQQVETLFHEAIAFEGEERNEFLERQCSDDSILLGEIKSLISAFESEDEFFESPVLDLGLSVLHKKTYKARTGTRVGFYEIGVKLGSGGMGEVYQALDTRLNRRVALKFLTESLENDNLARRQLQKEAQAVAMLEHSNICAVYGIEQIENDNFIVMQFIEGTTHEKSLKSRPVNPASFKSLARQIVGAVAFAHSHGVIHRDLKPGNIMLSDAGQIKVLDFGLAKIIGQKQIFESETKAGVSQFSHNGLIIGTISYMSPEQLRGEKLDYQTDIFSLGIILFELLAEFNPFQRQTQAETIAAILSDNSISAGKITPALSPHTVNLLDRCLERDKKKRFQSVAEILIELDKIEDESFPDPPVRKRSKFLISGALSLFIFLFLGISIFYSAPSFVRQAFPTFGRKKTVAVLPIRFEQAEPGKEYLADGLTQSLIDKLSDLSELKVKNKYAVESFKTKPAEPQAAGQALNVDIVYTAAILKRGDSLILAGKLVRTDDNFLIDAYESKIEDSAIIDLPESISARIIDRVDSSLTEADKNKLSKRDTENAEAQHLYYLGREYLDRREGDDLQKAIKAFTEATTLDISYAKAWSALAEAYLSASLPDYKGAMPPGEAANNAKAAAGRALKFEPYLADASCSLGMISLKYDWKWSEAEAYFRNVIARDSENLPARSGLVSVLKIQGRFDEAIEESEKAKELDPLSISPDLNIASAYYGKGDYEKMGQVLSGLLAKYPNNNRISYIEGYQLLKTGKTAEATEIFEKMYHQEKQADQILASAPLGYLYARTGRRNQALEVLDNLEQLSKTTYISSQEKAVIYLGLGDVDQTFDNLNKACRERSSSLPYLIYSPLFDEVKSDPRFTDIRKCVNL